MKFTAIVNLANSVIGLLKDNKGKLSSKRVAGLGGGTTLMAVAIQQIELHGVTKSNLALAVLAVACYYITSFGVKE